MKKEGEWLPGSRQSLLVRDRLCTQIRVMNLGKESQGTGFGGRREKRRSLHTAAEGGTATRPPACLS